MPRTPTPFDILGVTPEDDMTAIRMAWREKVRALHPDRASDKARATELLAKVNVAFDALQGHKPKRRLRPRTTVRATQPANDTKRPTDTPKARTPRPATSSQRSPQRAAKPTRASFDTAEKAACLRALSGYSRALKHVAAA